MPAKLINRATGAPELVDDADMPAALASGKYVAPDAVAVHRDGLDTYAAPDVAVQERAFTPTIDPALAARAAGRQIRERENSGAGAALKAGLGGAVSGASFGLLDPYQEEQEFNPLASGVGQIAGAIAPAFVGDFGGLAGLGRGAAIADDALTAERATSSLSSRLLYGGDAAAGAAGTAERGLARANAALGEATGAAGAADAAARAGLEGLDARGLRAAHEAELGAIEAGRVPARAALADDIAAFRAQAKEDALFLTTKGQTADGLNVLGKRTLKADRALDGLLDNPKRLASKPELALASLQQQESALEGILAKSDKLRATFAADTSGDRLAALEKIPAALERNRSLQTRIAELTAAPSSARTSAIADAQALLQSGGAPKSMAEQMLGGAVFSGAAGLAHALPGVGSMLAPLAGAKASKFVTDLVFGRLAKTTAAAADRAGAAVSAFLDVGRRAAPTLGVLATKTLANVAFAPHRGDEPRSADLAGHYRARTDELRSQTVRDATGATVIRPEARAAIGGRLAGIRAASPMLADRMETYAVRKLEYLASQIPTPVDYGALGVVGPRHHTSDLEMRSWARKVAAAEDPHGVLERLAHGSVTPEDADTMRAVAPEMMADVVSQIAQRLPELRASLPYSRRLALSIFAGAAVDPSMEPRVIAALQAPFQEQTDAARAAPQFGSVKAKDSDDATAAQRREQGTV